MTECHLGLGTKECTKIWMNVAEAIGLTEKPTSKKPTRTQMWIQHIWPLLYPLIMYENTVWEQPTSPKSVPVAGGEACLIQFRAATVDTHRAHRVLGTLIEKSWFVLRWRTWCGVCSEDWELNNVERQHTHIRAHSMMMCISLSLLFSMQSGRKI